MSGTNDAKIAPRSSQSCPANVKRAPPWCRSPTRRSSTVLLDVWTLQVVRRIETRWASYGIRSMNCQDDVLTLATVLGIDVLWFAGRDISGDLCESGAIGADASKPRACGVPSSFLAEHLYAMLRCEWCAHVCRWGPNMGHIGHCEVPGTDGTRFSCLESPNLELK